MFEKATTPHKRYGYYRPDLDEYDQIIIFGKTLSNLSVLQRKQPSYLGYCGNINNRETKNMYDYYKELVFATNRATDGNNLYLLSQVSGEMEYYLVKSNKEA